MDDHKMASEYLFYYSGAVAYLAYPEIENPVILPVSIVELFDSSD